MTELLTAAQMRAIEQAAIDSGQVTGLELMERAGQAVVEAIFQEWPELGGGAPAPGLAALDPAWVGQGGAAPLDPPEYFLNKDGVLRAVVLCGPGNNGGDGFVVARLLKARGWAVEVFLYGAPDKLPPDARVNYERWGGMGAVDAVERLVERLSWPRFQADAPDAAVFVDAAFGTGLTRPLPLDLYKVSNLLNDREEPEPGKAWIVAIDVPSGLCADSGRVIGDNSDRAFFVDLTVTFHAAKLGHFLGEGPEHCGKLVVTGIGL